MFNFATYYYKAHTMTPEEKARVKIDQMFNDAGWKVVDRDFYSPTITAAAIREGLLMGNRDIYAKASQIRKKKLLFGKLP